ncbi:hypothetical protein KBB68_02870 [Candidatus Babeliales bacterium]|nr:hypothetical protein [Candidatus Babeliales bacterium]
MKKLMLALITLTSVMTFSKGGYAPKKTKKVAVAAPTPVKVDPAVVAAQQAAAQAAAKAKADAENPFNDILAGFDGIQSGSTQEKLNKLVDIISKIDAKMVTFSVADIKLMPAKQKQGMALSLTDLSKRINAMLKEYLEYSYIFTFTNVTRSLINSDPVVADLLKYSDVINKHYAKINSGNILKRTGRWMMNHKKIVFAAYAALNVAVKLNRTGNLNTLASSLNQAGKYAKMIVLP